MLRCEHESKTGHVAMRTRVQDWTRVRILPSPVITDHWTEAFPKKNTQNMKTEPVKEEEGKKKKPRTDRTSERRRKKEEEETQEKKEPNSQPKRRKEEKKSQK